MTVVEWRLCMCVASRLICLFALPSVFVAECRDEGIQEAERAP